VFSVSTIKLHERYQPHFLTCYNLAKKSAIRSLELATIISKALTYMRERCTYDLIYELAQTAMSIRREYLGEKTYETTKSMIQLAQFYYQWLYYKEAETLLLRAKAVRMALFGRVDKYVVETNVHLVGLYQEWENHAEACRILNEELGNDMIPWGQMQESEEMRYVICRNWVIRINAKQTHAISRKDLSQMKECVEGWINCLKFCEDNFAADHPYIASVKYYLGTLYAEMPNALQQALRQYQQAKKILDNLDSPHTMAPVLCFLLAVKYTSAGRTQEARQAAISAAHEARRMLGNVEEIKPHSYFVVLGDIFVLLKGAANLSDVEGTAFEALANYDSWRGALEDTFKDLSATDFSPVAKGLLVSFACQLRLQLATSQKSRRQYEEAITNYVLVIQEVGQESPSSLPRTSGLSFLARLGLITLYREASLLYFGRVLTIRDESGRYLCEVVDEMATGDFKDWWGLLGKLLPVVNVSAMKMFNDPRKSGLQMNLQRIKDLAVAKDAELRRSQNDPHEAAVRQGLLEQLQQTLMICGVLKRNRFNTGLDSFMFR
jgi:tetratricopeptide (TPR) repeat protein